MEGSESKRHRTVHPVDLSDLPDSLLSEVASFLALGNRVLLAVALTAPAKSWEECHWSRGPPPACEAVLSSNGAADASGIARHGHLASQPRGQLETFDFGDVRKAAGCWPLSDVVLKACLICIDARSKLRSLKLTGCTNLSGRGLEPLRGSVVLGRIDLTHDSLLETSLTTSLVLPILSTIVERRSSPDQGFMRVRLPRKWKEEKSEDLTQFLENYDRILKSLTAEFQTCGREECYQICSVGIHTSGERYGAITGTCDECQECFCSDASDAGCEGEEPWVDYCDVCEKYLCSDCEQVGECSKCKRLSCWGCGLGYCDDCSKDYCWDCELVCHCSKCHRSSCFDCGNVKLCDGCETELCFDCGMRSTLCCANHFCNSCGCDCTPQWWYYDSDY